MVEREAGWEGSLPFEIVAMAPPWSWEPSVPIAASRAGFLGVLDLAAVAEEPFRSELLTRLSRLDTVSLGLYVDGSWTEFADEVADTLTRVECVFVTPDADDATNVLVERARAVTERVGLVVTKAEAVDAALAQKYDFFVAKGCESGGRIGDETTFVLLQRLLDRFDVPVLAWGGIGRHTATACRAGGASGIVLDWQLALTRESAVPPWLQMRIAEMDGSETTLVHGPRGELWRFHSQLGARAITELNEMASRDASFIEWKRQLEGGLRSRAPQQRLIPIGQDASLASDLAPMGTPVSKALRGVCSHVERELQSASNAAALGADGPLARSHGTTFPVVQGPMTRVSDVPAFCDAVERGGGLPFLALALMKRDGVRALLGATRELMGSRPWGVGILGFVDRETREAQLEVIADVRPPFAIVAGGRPDQARTLESQGTATYLHVPSPTLLQHFLKDGARRFVFEGRECGGHVGPRTSFVLWESAIQLLLDAKLSADDVARIHVLFAGGIHDARSGAMVAAMAQPLVERGMKVGVLLGTAYLFTEEAVTCGAITSGFQKAALEARATAILETGPGHGIRCAPTPYTVRFEAERTQLQRSGQAAEKTKETLERMHLGRLRLASKGLKRVGKGDAGLGSASAEEQRDEGMFMMGQVAALHDRRTTIRELHEDVCQSGVRWLREFRRLPEVSRRVSPPPPLDIAIVGLSCLLPGANDVESFWQNVLDKVDSVEEVPGDRFDVSRYFDECRDARDRIYNKWGGFLADVAFDPVKFGIPPRALSSIEPAQLLALLLVEQALKDAGYDRDNPDKARTSVILGAGGGMAELGAKYTVRAMLPGLLDSDEGSLYGRLPEWTEDSFAGILLNVISGRASNRFDLGGVNYTVDAACASSLTSVYLACRELTDGTSDMVIAGGCDTVQNPLSYLCFAKTGALSSFGRSRTFDAEADGIAISEGLAAVVLKRREDAERDGDRIYALIRAVAGASDGRQRSLTAPAIEGQQRTLRRAYEQAGFDISTLGLVEAHGTGTKLGDPTECRAVNGLLNEGGARRGSVAIGSVKSMIGHTKATAGVAGLIKATLAVHHRVLPATLHVQRPNLSAELESGPLYVNVDTRPWIRGRHPRRAGVSAFGFGGTNFHAVLEEYDGADAPFDRDAPRRDRDSELFLVEAASFEALKSKLSSLVDEVRLTAVDDPHRSLASLAQWWHVSRARGGGPCRAAFVARGADELSNQLESVLSSSEPVDESSVPGLYLSAEPAESGPHLAFLFPGQGSQFVNMMLDLCLEFSEVRRCFERADAVLSAQFGEPLSGFVFPPPRFDDRQRQDDLSRLKKTDITQPALGVCGVAMLHLLDSFGVRPNMVGGHSYGELVALHAAGVYDEATLYQLSYERGQAMVARAEGKDLGGMLAIGADERRVRQLIEGLGEVWLANLNSPRQTIVSGTENGLQALSARLESEKVSFTRVPVSCGFHSPLVEHAKERFARALQCAELETPRMPVFHNATASVYEADGDRVRALLADNLVRHVRFADEITAMHAAGAEVFVEVGPGNVLTKLVDQVLGKEPHLALATHPRAGNAITSLQDCLARLFARGVSVDDTRLYRGRPLGSGKGSGNVRSRERLWWLNGAYVRPMSEPKRRIPPPVRLVEAAEPVNGDRGMSSSAPPAVVTPGHRGGNSSAFSDFQMTMRRFLETQQSVLEAFARRRVRESAPRTEPLPSPPPPAVTPADAKPLVPPHESTTIPQLELDGADGNRTPTNVTERLLAVVSARTGYPTDVLDLEAEIESELGIDSIKRVEIIATCRRELLPELAEAPTWFVEEMSEARTLGAIVQGLEKLSGVDVMETQPVSMAAPEPPSRARPPVLRDRGAPRCVPVAVPADRSGDFDASRVRVSGCYIVTEDEGGVAVALRDRLEEAGGVVRFLSPETLCDPERVARRIAEIRAEGRSIEGLLHLSPLSAAPSFPGLEESEWARYENLDLRSMLFLLQALDRELAASGLRVLCTTTGGGDFQWDDSECVHPWRGGLAGLLKTAALEWPKASFRVVDFDDPEPTCVFDELFLDGPVEVGYRDGRRLALALEHREIPQPEAGEQPPLSADDVIVMTGGARGITAEIAIDLASRVPARFVLLGRTPHPDTSGEEAPETDGIADPRKLRAALVTHLRSKAEKPTPAVVEEKLRALLAAREIRRTLAAIASHGAEVDYRTCDVNDPAAFERVLREVKRRYGRLDVVVHGAGVIEDKHIVDKTAESFDRVVRTKVTPMLVLARLVSSEEIRWIVLFSSVAGFLGNRGQGDYAAANEMLNRMCRRVRALSNVEAVAMNWGPWEGAGMVSAEVAEQFRERGVGMVSLSAGRRAVWDEMGYRGRRDVRVLIGPGPWVPDSRDYGAEVESGPLAERTALSP